MAPFIDYYAVLGVKETASPGAIKAAFKKLALQYHPDVYKGEDAEERMRLLLAAYQTLSDQTARRSYDVQRSEHLLDKPGRRVRVATQTTSRDKSGTVSPWARRDRQRHYDFPTLSDDYPAHIDLGNITYDLSLAQAHTLKHEGMLRSVEQKSSRPNARLICHRCQHQWTPVAHQDRIQPWEDFCPACKADDWAEYLLLRCIHCAAVFESEQIRYEVGNVQYGDDNLCPPYELFPLCPYCGAAKWCPAEDTRVSRLREAVAKRAAMLRLVWISLIVVAVLAFGIVSLMVVR